MLQAKSGILKCLWEMVLFAAAVILRCFEAYASGPAIVQMAKEYIMGGKSSKFKELATEELSPYIVAQAALQGDVVAKDKSIEK